MNVLDLEAFRAAPLTRAPFEHLILPEFVRREARAAVNADYPAITEPGSFPLGQVSFGPGFRALIDALEGPEMRAAFADKFEMDLRCRPTTITVRGQCGKRDGSIRADIGESALFATTLWAFTHGLIQLAMAKGSELAARFGIAIPDLSNYAFGLIRTVAQSSKDSRPSG